MVNWYSLVRPGSNQGTTRCTVCDNKERMVFWRTKSYVTGGISLYFAPVVYEEKMAEDRRIGASFFDGSFCEVAGIRECTSLRDRGP